MYATKAQANYSNYAFRSPGSGYQLRDYRHIRPKRSSTEQTDESNQDISPALTRESGKHRCLYAFSFLSDAYPSQIENGLRIYNKGTCNILHYQGRLSIVLVGIKDGVESFPAHQTEKFS
jgi:hypothetical protein